MKINFDNNNNNIKSNEDLINKKILNENSILKKTNEKLKNENLNLEIKNN